MLRELLSVAALFASISPWSAQALAQTPLGTAWTYQGQLKDASSPVQGTYDLRFRLYDAALGGVQLGSLVCIDNVAVADGLFAVSLDFGPQFAGQQTFLEVDVRGDTGLNCGSSAGFVTLGPRQALTAAPNALFSLNAGKLDGLDSSAFLQSIPVPLNLTGSAFNIIGATNTSTDNASVGVIGASTAASGATYGMWGQSASVDGVGVRGQASSLTGATTGVLGYVQSASGRGVHGWAVSGTGSTYGGYFQSQSTSGVGAFGYATASAGSTYGLFGRSDSTTGKGVYGTATAATGLAYGVHGASASTSGVGTIGQATAGTGTTFGVYGQSDSSAGTGVSGITTNTGVSVTYGGSFRSSSQQGRGVYGRAASATGVTYGGYFETDSSQGTGVFAAGGSAGGAFEAAGTAGSGVTGQATAASGTTYGGWFKSASTSGYGVQGWANAGSGSTCGGYFKSDSTSGCGVFGLANAGSGSTYGGYFQSDSPTGRAVFGLAYADNGVNYGGRFQSASSEGRGVHGWATAASGTTYGGFFQADSAGGYGVFGRGGYYGGRFEGTTSIGRGVYGYVPETIGTTYGVFGQSESTSGRGVYGYASATGASDAPYGVRGFCSTATSGYAVWAAGDMGASGVKPFRIDHPSDPENKYLLHYATESPEVLNSYSGKVVLDQRGEAVVELPAYFAAVNKDPRYTLTAVGAPMPNLHVADEISELALKAGEQAEPGDALPLCVFRIAGGAPGAKVSWRVEAVRNDLRMRLHSAPVERDKTGPERGKYQHPDYYGFGPEMGMDQDAESKHAEQD